MTAQTVRLYKEARAIWWPWLLVTAVGILGTITAMQKFGRGELNPISRFWVDGSIPLGSFLGIPLLATMIFGLEFQHRTLALQLSQPIDRMQLWKEKMLVMLAAVVPATVIYCIGWSIYAPQWDRNDPFAVGDHPWLVAAACLVVAVAGAPFWTMVARTTLGSLVLNGMFPYWTIIWLVTLYDHVPASHAYWTAIQLAALASMLVYASAMVWLGRRKLATYQVSGAAGSDVLIETPIPLPRFVQEAFRCRPSGAVLNLLRKECRLMRPVWGMTLISAIGWTAISALNLLPPNDPTAHVQRATNAQLIMFALGVVSNLLIAVLSGVVPLGEEKTSGTHAWHMTLPVSARTQWIVKLLVGLTASVVFGALMPVGILMLRGFVSGNVWRFASPELLSIWPLALACITILAFWSACLVNGSLKAALWMFPIMWTLGLAGWYANSAAEQSGFAISSWMFSWADPFKFGTSAGRVFEALDRRGVSIVPPDPRVFLAPVVLLLLVQSYFLFRGRSTEGKLLFVRAIVPAAVLTFVCVFLAMMPLYLFGANYDQAGHIMEETHAAVQRWQEHGPQLVAGHPAAIDTAELAKSPAMSDRTRRWLSRASITIEPLAPTADPYRRFQFWSNVNVGPDALHPAYLEKIHLDNGLNCEVHFQQYPLHPNLALSFNYPKHGSLRAICD